MSDRPPASPEAQPREPTNCQREPVYPGHATVVMSLRYPDMTAHRPSARCAIHEPHRISECGEFRVGAEMDAYCSRPPNQAALTFGEWRASHPTPEGGPR